MILERPERRHRLEVRRQADLDRDAPVGDVLHQPVDVGLLILYMRVLDLVDVEEGGAVADTVGVALRDGLEY